MPAVPSLLRRRSAAVLLLLLTVAVVTVLPGGAAQAKRKPAPATPPPSPAKHVGVSTEGAPGGPELQELITSIGQVPDEVMWFVAWSVPGGFPTADAERAERISERPTRESIYAHLGREDEDGISRVDIQSFLPEDPAPALSMREVLPSLYEPKVDHESPQAAEEE